MPDSLSVEDEIVAALRRIIRAVDLHSRQLMQSVGLTWPQLAALRFADRLGVCSISALARAMRLGPATLTGIVQRLVRTGLLERKPHDTDGRSVTVAVTAAGRDLLGRAPSLLQDRFRQNLQELKDWERYQTLASLQRIAEMMDVESLHASPILASGPLDAGSSAASQETLEEKDTAHRAPRNSSGRGKKQTGQETERTEALL